MVGRSLDLADCHSDGRIEGTIIRKMVLGFELGTELGKLREAELGGTAGKIEDPSAISGIHPCSDRYRKYPAS